MEKNNQFVIAVYVDNQFGVLTRVTSMFTRRGFNIDALTVGETESPEYSRITITMSGDDTVKAQLALIKDMLNESDILFTSLTAEGKQNILSAIEEIENGSENPSSALQKKAYCASAVSALNGLKNTVSASFTDEKEMDAVNEEIDNLIYWLKITEKRMSSKS